MIIKANLTFRECKKYTDNDGKEKLRVRFLDNEDNQVILYLDPTEESSKYLSMKKDTVCTLDLNLYKTDKGKYNFYAIV